MFPEKVKRKHFVINILVAHGLKTGDCVWDVFFQKIMVQKVENTFQVLWVHPFVFYLSYVNNFFQTFLRGSCFRPLSPFHGCIYALRYLISFCFERFLILTHFSFQLSLRTISFVNEYIWKWWISKISSFKK